MPTQNKNIVLRPFNERGHTHHGWINSYHTFSFADYYDPAHMGFSTLRVINEDRIAPATGFGLHPHNDMEIISYVISGGLEHRDSMGNKTIILPDEVQIMSAGTGVSHAEMNYYKDKETHFLQIWILPKEKGLPPSYEQKSFKNELAKQNLTLVVSGDKKDGSIGIHQEADIYIGRLKPQGAIEFAIRTNRHVWIQMIKGKLQINSVIVEPGDGLSVTNEKTLTLTSQTNSEFILFDL